MSSEADNLPENLEQQVQTCLLHLYDYSFLESHPLPRLLITNMMAGDRIEQFRDLVTDAVERLRPGAGVAFLARAARSYNILRLRYIDQQDVPDVTDQLALSTRQFYREHAKAIQTLGHLLWQRRDSATGIDTAAPLGETISLASEVKRSHDKAAQTRVDLRLVLESAVSDAQVLGLPRQIHIALSTSPQQIMLDVDRTLLRQTILWITSQLIEHAMPGSHLRLLYEFVYGQGQIIFEFDESAVNVPALHAILSEEPTLATFVRTLEASLDYQPSPDCFRLILAIPLRQSTILVVDDNPDLVDLFRRYLTDQPYSLLAAEQGKQALQLARQSHPSLIVLDVMLPGQDGLEILQNLKTQVTTKRIPVLICSVLNVREIALSLGADAFLAKPPSQTDFLRVLDQWRV
jgi:CheY-like chemotaxis protein